MPCSQRLSSPFHAADGSTDSTNNFLSSTQRINFAADNTGSSSSDIGVTISVRAHLRMSNAKAPFPPHPHRRLALSLYCAERACLNNVSIPDLSSTLIASRHGRITGLRRIASFTVESQSRCRRIKFLRRTSGSLCAVMVCFLLHT